MPDLRTQVVAATVLASLAGCSTAAIESRTLPTALENHVASLPRFDASAHVVVPRGVAWNVAQQRLRAIAPIARTDPSQLTLQTHYTYESATNAGVRTQSRTYYDVQLVGDARRGLRASVAAHRETRTRGICGEPSVFSPVAVDGSGVARELDAAVDSRAAAPLDAFVFESSASTLAANLLASETVYEVTLGYGPDGSPLVEAMGRESGAQRRDVTIEVRSGYQAWFDAVDGGTRVRVDARLEHRTSDEDALGQFVSDDPWRVAEGVYGQLAGLTTVRDIVLQDEAPQMLLDAAPAEPPVEPPVEDFRGGFDLRVAFVADPSRQRDAAFWSGLSSVFVAVSVNDQHAVSAAISPYAARDWLPQPIPLQLAGDASLVVSLESAAPSSAEAPARTVPVTTLSASQLVRACGQLCVDVDGGSVCMILTRRG